MIHNIVVAVIDAAAVPAILQGVFHFFIGWIQSYGPLRPAPLIGEIDFLRVIRAGFPRPAIVAAVEGAAFRRVFLPEIRQLAKGCSAYENFHNDLSYKKSLLEGGLPSLIGGIIIWRF